jgi:hypothetical protein
MQRDRAWWTVRPSLLWGGGGPRSLRQSSPAQKLARKSLFGHGLARRASFPRGLRNSLGEACRAPFPRRPHDAHGVNFIARVLGLRESARTPSFTSLRSHFWGSELQILCDARQPRRRDNARAFVAAKRVARRHHSASTRQARPERPSGPMLRGSGSREGGTSCDHRRRVLAPPSDGRRARAEPGAARASAQQGPEGAGGRARSPQRAAHGAANGAGCSERIRAVGTRRTLSAVCGPCALRWPHARLGHRIEGARRHEWRRRFLGGGGAAR